MQIFEEALRAYQDDHQCCLRDREDLEVPEQVPWYLRDDWENRPSGPSEVRICDNALLRVSHQVHHEAFDIFYRVNKFHYSVYYLRPSQRHNWCPFPYERLPYILVHPHLEWMTDVSIDIIGSNQHDSGKMIDLNTAGHIKLISMCCGKLKTFTLHLLWQGGCEYIQAVLTGQSMTADALAVMKVRDRISIIGTAPLGPIGHLGYVDLRTAVAPEDCWDSSVLDDWPEISIQSRPYEGYRDGIERGIVAWRWDLDCSRRPHREAGAKDDGSPQVNEVE